MSFICKQTGGYRASIQCNGEKYRKFFSDLKDAIIWRKEMEDKLCYYKGGV